MKKVLILISVFIAITLTSYGCSNENIYSREDMEKAIASAEQRGFEEAYAEAEYYARMEIEKTLKEEAHNVKAEIEQLKRARDDAYEAGYQKGYSDCLDEHGWQPKNEYTTKRKK